MNERTEVLTTCLGHSMRVFKDDFIARKIRRQGLYERENLAFLDRVLASMKNAVVLDVGANIGNHSLAFSMQARQVHAFEPLPEVFALLEENIRRNGLSNVHAHNLALSDAEGEAILYQQQAGNVGASSFDRRGESGEPVPVRKRTGDAVVEELGLERLDLVKIDVEAHEAYVLKGLMHSLEKYRPYIVMEWNDQLTIDRLSDSEELRFLFREYEVHVLGSTHDRGYWRDRPLAFLRRKLTRLTRPRRAVLYEFHPARLYKNLLLVPRGKERYLPALHGGPGLPK